jgi:hypothetical protein
VVASNYQKVGKARVDVVGIEEEPVWEEGIVGWSWWEEIVGWSWWEEIVDWSWPVGGIEAT